MEYKELLEEIKKVCEDNVDYSPVSAFAYGEFDTNDIIGEYEEVAAYGGEDCGSTWYKVYHFLKHDIYIRVDGWYQSYNGTEFYEGWGCCSQVSPKIKQITVFE